MMTLIINNIFEESQDKTINKEWVNLINEAPNCIDLLHALEQKINNLKESTITVYTNRENSQKHIVNCEETDQTVSSNPENVDKKVLIASLNSIFDSNLSYEMGYACPYDDEETLFISKVQLFKAYILSFDWSNEARLANFYACLEKHFQDNKNLVLSKQMSQNSVSLNCPAKNLEKQKAELNVSKQPIIYSEDGLYKIVHRGDFFSVEPITFEERFNMSMRSNSTLRQRDNFIFFSHHNDDTDFKSNNLAQKGEQTRQRNSFPI